LAGLLNDNKSVCVKVEAVLALSSIGPGALPVFQQALASPDAFVRGPAKEGLKQLGTNVPPEVTIRYIQWTISFSAHPRSTVPLSALFAPLRLKLRVRPALDLLRIAGCR
jgi:hypothetical protein